jgi:hypothetical protein
VFFSLFLFPTMGPGSSRKGVEADVCAGQRQAGGDKTEAPGVGRASRMYSWMPSTADGRPWPIRGGLTLELHLNLHALNSMASGGHERIPNHDVAVASAH